jgi:ribosomal protein S9
MYFTQDTEDAIVRYNNTEDVETRESIFRSAILHPFQKLVENVFNTFKFSYFETGPQDVQKECLTHLVANMHKFDPKRPSKNTPGKKTTAFAYFSIVAKHYLILLNNTNYKKFNQNIEISDDKDETTVQLQAEDKHYEQQELIVFIGLMVEFWENNVEKIFTKQRDLNIANAVIELFRSSARVDAFNKKALYLYIREMARCKTQQITKVINRMKQYHTVMHTSYLSHGDVNTERCSTIT